MNNLGKNNNQLSKIHQEREDIIGGRRTTNSWKFITSIKEQEDVGNN